MIRRRGVLALSPDLSRTGAPRLLASLLTELAAAEALDPARTRVLTGHDGPTAAELPAGTTVRVLGTGADLARRLGSHLPAPARPAGDRVGVGLGLLAHPAGRTGGPPDLVWANGAASARTATALPGPARRAPLVVHVHELAIGLRRSLAGRDARALLDRADVVVAVAHCVRDHLVEDVGLAAERVVVHHGWVPGLAPTGPAPVEPRRPAGVPPDALVVGACGSMGWRKGTDLFAELARRLPARVAGRPVHLVWVGGPARPGDDRRAAAELRLRGVADRAHLVGEVPDAAPWLAGFDLLVLPSREDPFPLVVLEAGARGIPVAGFASGGVVEALPDASHADCLAPPLDVGGLAERVEALLADGHERGGHGADLRARVCAHHAAAPAVRELWADVAARLARS